MLVAAAKSINSFNNQLRRSDMLVVVVELEMQIMNDEVTIGIPLQYAAIKAASAELNFTMPSDLYTGILLKTLIASKPCGRFLELGTGTGLATAWMLSGMDSNSQLVSVDNNGLLVEVAQKNITDSRVEFVLADGYQWLTNYAGAAFDLIFADAMLGKYDLFEETIAILNISGIYVIDDMLPQPNWPAGHVERVEAFLAMLDKREDLLLTRMNWSTGIVIVVKK